MTHHGKPVAKHRDKVAAFLWVFPAGVLAAPESGTGSGSLFTGAYLLQVAGSLLLVFGCIFGLIFLLKKLNALPLASGSPIRVLASARLGSREKIVLVEAGEQQLLIGVAAGSIRTLHVLEQPIIESNAPGKKTADFASLLRSSTTARPLT